MSKVTNKVNPINYDWWKEDKENSQETTETTGTSDIPESVVVDMPKEETKDDTTTVSPPSYKRPIHETVVEENPDKELLERMQMSADLGKFATGLQWDSVHNTLRNAGVNPVSAKIAEDRLNGDKEVGDYLTQIGMPVDEEGYLDMTYRPTEKGWIKKIYDEYIKKGYLEAERDANGNIVNLRRNREASVAPFIEEAVRNTPLPKSFTAGSQSKYFSDITQSVIAQMPKDENGRILYNGQYFPFDEVYTGLYPAIAQKVHEDMLDSNKEYFDANFLRATGQTYEDWYRGYASKRVDEMEVRIGELRDAVASDAEKVAYAKGREVAMSSATLVPASVLGWASGKGAAAESKKMFDDALEEINNFRKNNFGSGFQESFDTLGFLTFGLADLGSTYTQMQLLEKARRGDTLSDTEKNVLELLNIQQEFATIKENLGWEASLGSKIGSGIGATVEVLGPFGGAMMGTSMVGNVVKLSTGVAKGAFKANVKAVGKNILNNTLVGYMRGAIAAPLMPNTYTEYTKALKSQYAFNEDGSISFTPKNKRLAYMSAYIDGMNEIASEVYGSTIGELIGYGARTFGRVTKLNKVVDALYTPVSKKVDDVLSKVGDTPKAMAFRRAVSNFVDPMKGLDPETRELLRVAGVQDGIFAEATSEVAGDFMATVMKDMVGAEVNYDDYHDKDFWLMQLAVAGLYGGTMSTIGKAGEAVSTYNYIAGVGEQNRRIIDSVESAELRDMLLAITADGNIDRAYIKLAGIDWSAYHPTDKDKAASFVRGSYALHAAMGSVQEDKRARAFAAEAQKLTSNAYRGKDGYTPVSNDPSLIEVESEGRTYYVISGVPADKSDTSMLNCVDMETGEQKAILAAKANVTSIKGVNEVLQQRYNEMFSAQVEAERIESIKSAYGQMERPTAEIAKSLMAQCGIIPPKEGDVVTLADGRSVEVMQDLEDGTYVVRLQDRVPLLFTVPFYNLKSNDTLTAAAQELMLGGKVESATREAVEIADKAVENGAEVATSEAPSAQSNSVEQRFSIKEAGVASEAQTTMEAQETEVANAVEDMENIPTTEDGEVDYDAIKSPTTFAKAYVKEAGSVKQARTEVKEMRAAAEQELQKIVERGGKEYTASKKRAAAREQRAIQERIAFYDAVAREMELLETKTEAEFSNIIENEYSVQVSAPVKKVVDGLAKELGLKVRFVEDADGQNAYILGNEVVISYKNRQKSIAFLIGHEYTHRMQDVSPKQYAKFKSMVREAIGEERWNSLVENLKKEYEKQGKSITDTQLEDEVTADAAGELVENRDVFIEHLQHKASDVGFLGFLRTIFRGLANTLRRIGATDREKTILDIVSQLDYLIGSAARNVAKTSAQGEARYSARIAPEMDATYLDAVERGDMEKAQQMVMEAAKLAMPNTKVVDEYGNPKVVYHQTNHSVYINRETGQNWDELDWRERMEWDERDDWDDYWEERDFNTFSRVNARTTQELDGFFFAPEYDEYHEYGDRTISAFLNITNPASFGDYNIDASRNNAGRDERIRLQNEGYDGVINEEDGAIYEYIAFNPNQIKSADPVTYDDNGNVIPLSERFNPRKEDIRYSMMSSIRALNDALIDYYDTHDIEGLLSDIQEINEKLALNHPYLANTILDYVEDGNAEKVVERIKYLVDGFDEGYEYTTGEDIRYSLSNPYGGNSGYVGYSMSKRAAEAREEGRYPKSDFKKVYDMPQATLDVLVNAGVINDKEWHHTSVYGNKTTFYGWGAYGESPYMSEYYKAHKAEIDEAAKNHGDLTSFLDGFEAFETDVDANNTFIAQLKAQAEAEREAQRRAEEQLFQKRIDEYKRQMEDSERKRAYVEANLPAEFVASNGVTIKPKGYGEYSAYRDGEAITSASSSNKRKAASKARAEFKEQIVAPLEKAYASQGEVKYSIITTEMDASTSAPAAETQTITTSNGDMIADVNEAQGQALFSLRTYREGGRDVLADFLATRVKDEALTESEASEMMQQMDDIYAFCETMKDHYAPFGQWSEAKVVEGEDGKPALSVIKANGDYAMNLDFSLVCKKRRTLDAVLNKMVKSGMIKNVSQKDTTIAKINEVIRKYGFETACALCFVDARRFQVLKTARAFCDLYNGVVNLLVPKKKNIPINEFNFAGRSDATEVENGLETMSDDALNIEAVRKIGYQIVGKKKDGSDMYPKTVVAKIARHLVEHPEDRRYVSPSDFVSTAGFDKVKATKPAIMSLYNSKKGTGGPKAAYSDVQYLNDIIKADWDADAAYAVGGVRVQSFSDYVPRMVFDYIQMVAELAAKKLPAHAYTKEPLFAKTFGLTGLKINLSLVPDVVADGIAAGLDANGNYVWKTNETFPYEEAVALQEAEGYRDNCGTIAVGVSDAHILKMLDDPNIRMVIPYHKSGLPKQVAKMNNVATFTDYTNVQNTTHNGIALSKEDAKNVPNYNELLREHKDARKAAQAYVEWCTERGYTPKFAKFATHPNYYKLLEDFTTMVDGNYVPQGAMSFTFPTEQSAFGSLETLIEQGLEEDAVLEGMRDERVDAIVDEVGEVLGVKPKYSLRTDGASIFYSNAQKAVLDIKQEKATPEQWLKMIEKAGGLKAGEDKWLGLSDWLKASTAKTLTKDEVLQYIADNNFVIEEVEYADINIFDTEEYQKYDWEFIDLEEEIRKERESETNAFMADMKAKYDVPTKQKAFAVMTPQEHSEYETLRRLENTMAVKMEVYSRMVEKYGTKFEESFGIAEGVQTTLRIKSQEKAAEFLGIEKLRAMSPTRKQYTTRGLENKREIALAVPSIEPYNQSDEIHFGDAGDGRAVAWIRFGETTDGEGNRVLVIDEIQSKRHQDGREKGYKDETQIKAIRERIKELESARTEAAKKILHRQGYSHYTDENWSKFDPDVEEKAEKGLLGSKEEMAYIKGLNEEIQNLYAEGRKLYNGIPSAPFEKNWAELAMKRMLRYAAENGYDYVAWTTGEQQSERYDMGNVISEIAYWKEGDEYGVSAGNNEDLQVIDQRIYSYDQLVQTFGRKIADDIANDAGVKESVLGYPEDPNVHYINGEDLRIGGEGMKAFYDQMLPSFVKKYTKKWGAEVGEVTMPNLEENNTMHAVNVTDAMRESVMQGQPRFSIIGEKGAAKIFEDDSYGSPAVDLEVAREMEAEGKDVLSIRLATGWERGADDKWRYEIMDGEYHHPADMSQPVRLSDILDNPALYEAYPDLADMKVEFKPLDKNRNGYYDGKGIVINSGKGQAQNASTLIHEIQHAIQHREGFAQGGNSKSFEEGLDEIEAKLTVLKGDFDNLIRSSKGEHLLRRLYIATKALGKMLQINYLNAKKDIIEYDAYQRYRKLAGEVEARNVQARHAMSRHERAWTPIGETEDVARESQEFVYRTAQSSSDAPRYSVRREDVDNGNIDNAIESLDTARTELERIVKEKKLTKAEKHTVMRGVKALISQELRDGLLRFTRNSDILRMMDAVNEAKAPDAMLNAVIRAMRSIYGIKYRKEYARMRSLTKTKITLGVTEVNPEDFLDRLIREKKITGKEAQLVVENYWKRVNARGVSVAKYVDNDTRQVMEFVNAMMDIEKAKALLTEDMKKKMSLGTPPQDIIRAVRTTIENDEIADGKLAEALKDESLKQQIIDITDVLEEYWTALDQYSSITEDKTPEEVNSVMPDIIKHMANANDTIEGLLKTGKVKLSEERKQRKMQERYLIYDALQDMGVTNTNGDRILEDTRDFRRRVWHRVKGEVGKWPGIALGSMEYMLRKIGVNAPMGEGRIFNHFAPKLQRAYDKTFTALAECNKALDEKCKSLWGKTYAEMQKMAENTKVGQTYHERDIYVTQAIYLLAMWEQPDARAALEKKQGMDVALVDKIRQALDALDPRWREFSEWVVKEFLPSRREKYNAVHRKIFGTSLGNVPNYFPIKRAGESIHSVVDVSIPEMDALPSTIVGSIVERTKNVLPIDVETSFFEALNENITTMEGWAEMVGIIRDFNTLLSNRTVREAMNDIAPYMYSDFKKAAQVATLSYVGKTPDIDKNVGTVLSRMWAGTKISFRLYTAFKQLSSALLFAGYSGDPEFQARLLWRYLGSVNKARMGMMLGILRGESILTESSVVNPDVLGNIKWCMENLPSFRQRWESRVAGFEVMKRTLGNKSWKQRTWVNAMDEVVQKVATFGFKPNAFVDAFTVAAGARTIFDYEYERLQEEEGYNEEQARVLAIVKAEMAFNSSQQSSEGLYLAPLQVDRSLLSSAVSTFMNASFAMSRNATQGIYELIRSASKELAEIEDMTYRRMIAPYKKVIKETIAEERAAGAFADENAEVSRYTELLEAAKAQVLPRVKEIAKKKLRDAKIKAVLAVVIYGYGGQFAFQLMAELPTLLFGDDDEEKKQIVKDTAINSLWSAPLSMIPVINLIPAAVAGYDINLFPAVDELGEDIGKIIKGIAKVGVNIEVANITVRLGLRWGLGLDIDTWKNIYLGVENMFEDGVSAEAILKVMNGPETQIRKIIGQRRDDESEKEYIERIMRFYSIAENPMFSAYPDAGKYYEGYEIEGKGINYFDYHGGSPKGMTDRDMQRIDFEKAYRRNIVLRYGGGKEYARFKDIDEKFNEYVKTIGSPEDVYWRGYYETKMENLEEKEWSDLMTLKAEVNGYEKWLQHFTGSDESYYEVVKEVEEMKQKFNETYEQFK